MPKKFGEPDKDKNILSLNDSELDSVTGGLGNKFSSENVLEQAMKNLKATKKKEDPNNPNSNEPKK
ncbi:MAG: hypothetical protein LBT82_00600 [Oscillospiraceae bacterium]|jgi:hypothetical protein|nr:hypothetical protein [Oscillospiraceae bacterium]